MLEVPSPTQVPGRLALSKGTDLEVNPFPSFSAGFAMAFCAGLWGPFAHARRALSQRRFR